MIYKTQKWIWEISSGLGDIKLINYFNVFPKLKLRELKIINVNLIKHVMKLF